jgi:hypothetical protein
MAAKKTDENLTDPLDEKVVDGAPAPDPLPQPATTGAIFGNRNFPPVNPVIHGTDPEYLDKVDNSLRNGAPMVDSVDKPTEK